MRTLILLPSVLLLACGQVNGNGNVTTTTREVTSFRKLRVADALNATVTTGARSVTVRTDENLQGLIESVIEGDALVLRLPPGTGIGSSTALEVTVVNEVVEGVDASGAANVIATATAIPTFAVSASGSSTVSITGVSSDAVDVSASGSSDVTLAGSAMTGQLNASGSSNLSLRDLPLDSAVIALSGASTLHGRVATSLSGSASGASNAFITGNPSSTVGLSGSSNVTLGAP